MQQMINLISNLSGAAGLLICLGTGISRLLGHYHIMGSEVVTLFIVGIALMVAACLGKLYIIELD